MSLTSGVLFPSRAVKTGVRTRRSHKNWKEDTSPVGKDDHEDESGCSPGEQWIERLHAVTYRPLLPRAQANFPTEVGSNI